jgi:hypothetical protein
MPTPVTRIPSDIAHLFYFIPRDNSNMPTLITTNNTLNPPPEVQDKNPDVSNSNSTLAAVAKASVETDDDIKDPPQLEVHHRQATLGPVDAQGMISSPTSPMKKMQRNHCGTCFHGSSARRWLV